MTIGKNALVKQKLNKYRDERSEEILERLHTIDDRAFGAYVLTFNLVPFIINFTLGLIIIQLFKDSLGVVIVTGIVVMAITLPFSMKYAKKAGKKISSIVSLWLRNRLKESMFAEIMSIIRSCYGDNTPDDVAELADMLANIIAMSAIINNKSQGDMDMKIAHVRDNDTVSFFATTKEWVRGINTVIDSIIDTLEFHEQLNPVDEKQ